MTYTDNTKYATSLSITPSLIRPLANIIAWESYRPPTNGCSLSETLTDIAYKIIEPSLTFETLDDLYKMNADLKKLYEERCALKHDCEDITPIQDRDDLLAVDFPHWPEAPFDGAPDPLRMARFFAHKKIAVIDYTLDALTTRLIIPLSRSVSDDEFEVLANRLSVELAWYYTGTPSKVVRLRQVLSPVIRNYEAMTSYKVWFSWASKDSTDAPLDVHHLLHAISSRQAL